MRAPAKMVYRSRTTVPRQLSRLSSPMTTMPSTTRASETIVSLGQGHHRTKSRLGPTNRGWPVAPQPLGCLWCFGQENANQSTMGAL
jgi:hypothetical protein